ncbi:hypothetical protein ACFQX6_50565 [Streptosporangium lutulentum]
MTPGVGHTVNSTVGELTLNWQDRPVLESLKTLLADVGAKEGSHLFLTLSDEGVLRARHLRPRPRTRTRSRTRCGWSATPRRAAPASRPAGSSPPGSA